MIQEDMMDGEQAQANLRKNLRSPLIVTKVKLDDHHKTFFGYSKNISRSGFFIATATPREPGSRYEVEIPLPPPVNRTIQVVCEVVWKRHFSPKSPLEPGMGLRFVDLPEEMADLIDAWVRQRLH